MTAGVYEGGMLMAGTGQMIGESVLILYNDPAAHSVLSLGQTDGQTDGHRTVLILYNDPAAHSVLSLGQTDRQTDTGPC